MVLRKKPTMLGADMLVRMPGLAEELNSRDVERLKEFQLRVATSQTFRDYGYKLPDWDAINATVRYISALEQRILAQGG